MMTPYDRAVAKHLIPDFEEHESHNPSVVVTVEGEEGFRYSSWTFEDAFIEVRVQMRCPSCDLGFNGYAHGPEEVVALFRSFALMT
jgi:hypothetical protein